MTLIKIFVAAFSITIAAAFSHAMTPRLDKDGIVLKKDKKDPKKTEITPSELPEVVKDSIMKGDYAQWNIVKAYIITYSDDAEKVEYEVHFTNEQGKKSKQIVVYDKEGKIIED